MSRRFRKAFGKASVRLQGLIQGAIHDLVNHIREDNKQFKRNYGRLAQISDVLEVDVSGASRLLATYENGELNLLDVGGHEIVPRYNSGLYATDRFQKLPAPETYWPEGPRHELNFFARSPCFSYSEFGPEQQQEWLYFLSDQQSEILTELFVSICDTLKNNDQPRPFFIVGGPGTGKTSILINLLKEMTDYGHTCSLSVSQEMVHFTNKCLPEIEIDRFICDHGESPLSKIWLVDDPADNVAIEDWLKRAASSNSAIVVAFDPCQLSSFDPKNRKTGIGDEQYNEICLSFNVDPYGLNECYRQKENVGRAAKNIMDQIAESTPFLASHKIQEFQKDHKALTTLANDLEFPNPYGYCETYTDSVKENFPKEIDRIMSKPLWTHWPPLLMVFEENFDLVSKCFFKIHLLSKGIQYKEIDLNDIESVKGLEYQHVFLAIGQSLFDQLENGFQGSGQQEYANRRLLRIPYSRAKDSMVVFVE